MKQIYKHAGFTLAELLAVVIIVALLSSLSLGYYKRSVEQSRFAEGLTAASAFAEAVNQAYFDDQMDGKTNTSKRKIKTLDIALANKKACSTASDYCQATPRFEVNIEETGGKAYVRAYRGTSDKHKYYIEVQPVFGSPKDQISCGADKSTDKDAGLAFCQAMGYTSCSSYKCTK
ncbi:MAG: type II secretion system protein [Elusimicrobiaceae bacterium]|nr:type II secretion system protein [Elusimicrobiaceae bacterium]